MKLIYLDCGMGAAGDMLMAALYELLPDGSAFLDAMHGAGIPGLTVAAEKGTSRSIAGTRMKLRFHGAEEEDHPHHADHGHHEHHEDHDHHSHHDHHDHDHGHDHDHHHDHHEHHGDHEHHGHHHGMSPEEIFRLLDTLALPEAVLARAKKVYHRIAEAEAKVHGTEIGHIHFHELGSLDALADVVGVCLLTEMLGVDKIVCSPIRLGTGQVRCAHGLLPVPAPATAQLLLGLPCYGGEIQGELCTPTGAALLAELVQEFGAQPDMIPQQIGTGLGKREFAEANCLRATLGEQRGGQRGEITELVCNLDDMTPEALAFAQTVLLERGALDVYIQAGTMKKGRSGHVLTVLCAPEDEEALACAVFENTSTIGLRVRRCGKYFLTPSAGSVETKFGTLRTKRADGWGISREKAEFDSAAALAKENGVALSEIYSEYSGS